MPEEELDARAAALLYKLLRESLAGYERTNEEDEALLAGGGLGERMGMCVEYRLSVKRNVEAFVRFLAKMEELVE